MGDLRCEGPAQGLVYKCPVGVWGVSGAHDPAEYWYAAGAQHRLIRAKCSLFVTSSHPSLINPSNQVIQFCSSSKGREREGCFHLSGP